MRLGASFAFVLQLDKVVPGKLAKVRTGKFVVGKQVYLFFGIKVQG